MLADTGGLGSVMAGTETCCDSLAVLVPPYVTLQQAYDNQVAIGTHATIFQQTQRPLLLSNPTGPAFKAQATVFDPDQHVGSMVGRLLVTGYDNSDVKSTLSVQSADLGPHGSSSWGDLSVYSLGGLQGLAVDVEYQSGDSRLWTKGPSQKLHLGSETYGDVVSIDPLDPEITFFGGVVQMDGEGAGAELAVKGKGNGNVDVLLTSQSENTSFSVNVKDPDAGAGNSGGFGISEHASGSSWNRLLIEPGGNVGIGVTDDPQAKLDVAGRVRAHSIEVTAGADIAESFPVSSARPEDEEPGTVMVIDSRRTGHLRASSTPYDTRVAGVVSGAGGVPVGMSLGHDEKLGSGPKVALTGRVYVKAEADSGPIRPGDLLTTSSLRGHAMRVDDAGRSGGAVLGKAMSSLESGRGLVLVLVSLQ